MPSALAQVGDIDSEHKGKLECCLIDLLEATPGRCFAKGAVFNGAEVVLYEARRNEDGKVFLYESPMVSMATGAALQGRQHRHC